MLEKLITSRTRSKILELFLSNPDMEIHLREVGRRIEENYNSTRRELNNLEDMTILISRKNGNQRYFRINKDNPIYPDLKSIYLKTSGIGNAIRNSLDKIGEIRYCFIYGSYASNTEMPHSDLDLFVVGEIDENELIPIINGLEKRLKREINYILYTLDEYQTRKKNKNKFVLNVLREDKIMIHGDENEL